jgi:hypothetical protein
MAALMDRVECSCGCYVNIRSALEQAVKENEDRPMRAVVVIGDVFHDDKDSLTGAAIAINKLRRAGTRVFLVQTSLDPHTASKLQSLQRLCGATYFQFDSNARELDELLEMLGAYASGGEEAVKASGKQAATLLLEHLKQQPMPIPVVYRREEVT